MKEYENLEIEIIRFETEDMITTSDVQLPEVPVGNEE